MRTGRQTLQSEAERLRTKMQNVPQNSSAPAALPKPMCDICFDAGWLRLDVPIGDPQFGETVRCSCKAQEDAARLQRLSGLTETERSIRLSAIETNGRKGTTAMVKACEMTLQNPTGSLVIHGTSGNAKTVALQGCVNELLDRNVEAVYITAFDLISHIREAFNENKEVKSESAYERIVRFGTVPFLAIDELDKVKWTGWVEEQITDLMDRRYRLAVDGQAGTMIAMNGDPELLPMWIYSRLSQGEIVRNDDSDLRPHLKG